MDVVNELVSTGVRRCCAECTPGCEFAGLMTGQYLGDGGGWDGQPFPEHDGVNSEAVAFWGGIGCCNLCAECRRCQS
jgi:hypothetical protein